MATAAGAIVTLTANPSFDRTIALPEPLERGAVHRVDAMTSQAGGKGVNISRAAVAAGLTTVAVLPARPDDAIVHELAEAGIDCRPSRPAGDIRVNLTLTEPDGTTTKLNGPGAAVTAEHLEDLAETLVRHARGGAWTVLAGSLPPGAPATYYADLVAAAARGEPGRRSTPATPRWRRSSTGCPGRPRPAQAERRGARVGHRHRGRCARGRPGRGREGLPHPGRARRRRGPRQPRRKGAVLVDPDGAWYAPPPPTTVVSTVGAGDCTLFGYLLGSLRGLPAPDRLALAVAYGAAAAGLPGTTIPHPADLHPERVAVQSLDPT